MTAAIALPNLAAELKWLKDNPAFEERPATLNEFLGPNYLDVAALVRPAVKDALAEMVGSDVSPERPTVVPFACYTGAIGIGKTTVASIILPYLAHWLLCLKNPQAFFDFLPGSRIALMNMSTSEKQALEVLFGDVDARIKHSPWFEKYPRDPNYKKEIRWPKNIWLLPGDSSELTYEGYNLFGGILDEADSHKVTQNKDYAEGGFNTISNRMTSRFGDRGFVLVIGQCKSAGGFALRKYEEFKRRKDAVAVRMTIWESRGDDYYKDASGNVEKFAYDTHRKVIVPSGAAQRLASQENLLWVPELYRGEFENDPVKALRDLAGIPPAVGDPFISLVDRIDLCPVRWQARFPDADSPVNIDGRLEKWFRALDSLRRAVHVDIAYAEDGDAMGIAMGHVPELVEIDGELKPYIVFDFLLRWTAPAGGEIFLSDMRHLIYELRDERRFKIAAVTLDGFQSVDTIQQLQKRKIDAEYLSIDKNTGPYMDLREAIYEKRVDFPPYVVRLRNTGEELQIAVKELMELVDAGKKVDHPPEGSKDVADSMAGVVFTLMGDRRYRRVGRQAPSLAEKPGERVASGPDDLYAQGHPALTGAGSGLRAPLPPSLQSPLGKR